MPAATMTGSFIALDWGTTSFRAYLVDAAGHAIDERGGPDGILTVAAGGFEPVLERHIAIWDATLPVLAAGMITSKQGWVETSYCPCPAGLDGIVARIERRTTAMGRAIAFIPGMSCEAAGIPDVMRGEETQVFGALDGPEGEFVLPGTHSKWVTVRNGRITGFTTYMTGEVFAALKQHTILGRLMQDGEHDRDAFARGVSTGLEQGRQLLHAIFSARTLGLFGNLAPASLASYLSGLLIGAEISGETDRGCVSLVGASGLCARYSEAFAIAGRTAAIGNAQASVSGLHRIGQAAGLFT